MAPFAGRRGRDQGRIFRPFFFGGIPLSARPQPARLQPASLRDSFASEEQGHASP